MNALQGMLKTLGPSLLVVLMLMAYDRYGRPRPEVPPVPLDRVAEAAKVYGKALPASFQSAAEQVRGGRVTDINGAVGAVEAAREASRNELADALDGAFRAIADPSGMILDRAAAAGILERAAQALEGGR